MASRFENLELNIQMGWLLDYYSLLLTDRQSYVLNLYYNEDWSLAEIADELNVSRQNIYDIINRAGKKLQEYEHKLKLVERTLQSNYKLDKALKILDKSHLTSNDIEIIKQNILEAIQNIEEA